MKPRGEVFWFKFKWSRPDSDSVMKVDGFQFRSVIPRTQQPKGFSLQEPQFFNQDQKSEKPTIALIFFRISLFCKKETRNILRKRLLYLMLSGFS
ncbi:hypothetical protein CRP01_40750 [Flavilitoribacter nigricans DSM 23189 = NBRC 102662]|uniref:Uncharacterized protein n=1 Tax=Flavilitoribacter nigricans (strain ATCC 23147 / DSM 23189 / NBRC 102662 / NCIMB 1420 / SS-2) TaxID=1122177 RepID=A0A2D0MX51_FLAN2|nr:hypothetical protein CRP01_40750 [Flavilitoribacter nigricans DSM 23189 = NBRC 102662]